MYKQYNYAEKLAHLQPYDLLSTLTLTCFLKRLSLLIISKLFAHLKQKLFKVFPRKGGFFVYLRNRSMTSSLLYPCLSNSSMRALASSLRWDFT